MVGVVPVLDKQHPRAQVKRLIALHLTNARVTFSWSSLVNCFSAFAVRASTFLLFFFSLFYSSFYRRSFSFRFCEKSLRGSLSRALGKMRRGSVSTWENFGRRSSANMAQFTGGPVEFMTTDDIKYGRKDGCFLTYKKAAIFLPIFILGLIAAGLIGWYYHTMPKKRVQDALSLLNEDTTKERDASRAVPPFARPLKYWLYFKPTIVDDQSVAFKGQVVIEFRIDAPPRSNKLSLNAVDIVAKRYELSFSKDPEKEKEGRKRRAVEVAGENDSNNSTFDNTTVVYETIADYRSENDTNVISNDTLLDTNEDWFMEHSVGKGNEIIDIREYEMDVANELHVIHCDRTFGSGTYFLRIDYEVSNLTDVVYAVDIGDDVERRWMLGTLLKPMEARRIFPLFDGLDHRAIFSLSVERSKEMRVLSNMPLRSTKHVSANWVTDTFDDTPPIWPHDLAFVIADLSIVERTTINPNNVTATFWAEFKTSSQFTERLYSLDKVEPILLGLTDILSVPYTLPKLDVVALPSRVIKDSGNSGLVSMRKSLFFTTDRSSIVTKTEALKSLIGLLGEQWFGGRVNMKSLSDSWISKGSLIYLEDRLIDEIDSSLQFAHSFVADVQTTAMEDDGYSISRSFQVKIDPSRVHWLKKREERGACLIRMLHGAIKNDTAFKMTYENFLTFSQNESIGVDEFSNSTSVATDEFPEKLSLKEMMDRWIAQSGYPLVTVTRDYEHGSTIVKQKAFFYDKPAMERDTLWHVPLTYTDGNGSWSDPIKIWLQPKEEKIIYETERINDEGNKTTWILFNVNKTGYYRVNYDETNWQLLATALDENHEAFPPETRASLVDDVFALATVGTSRYETAFGFIKYMQMKERHYAPWSAFAHHVFKLNNLLYESSAFLDFQEFLQQFIKPLYDEISGNLEEGSRLTLLAIKLACLSEYSKCLDWAKQCFVRLKTDPAYKSNVPKYVRETLYCTIARHGGREEWNYLSKKAITTFKAEEKRNLLSSYGCFQTLGILNSILDELLRGDAYSEEETDVILKSFSMNLISSRAASKFIKRNWKDIFERFSGSSSIMEAFIMAMSNSVTTERDLDDLHTFWEDNYESIKTAKQAAALVEARANLASALIKNYSRDIDDWLKKFNSDHEA